MSIHKEPELYFDEGQYLLADSAYGLSMTCIPAYKSPASNITANKEFNYCIAKARVRNEHSIGILKGRWASLQQLRLLVYKKRDMLQVCRWVNACMTLHNMLAHLGDSWDEICPADRDSGSIEDQSAEEGTAEERHRAEIQAKCLALKYSRRVLPL
ncbi:uncharacterized protein PGTG_00982 [Puccinia graminis f. sp. tritici CRL 75-36-700-3]|uniref:DDE Tnp4 domain-containing protein n=1 Tax=Puccinia graminis f. sp. tritici (strain CRL 75-36-700-3 / race SCCL) TaxID=418459 RepID=E3JUC6_PUCGT|nr:uncharacterized protein PGTG_00982 [Puccinia graminis f. sp. tritici CRL 75-36-700-3]EFP75651.1 hypothetical protein PGTG_00982 [Puccinia graminis f. sp. tritici CRL 75-36-700-3]